MAGESYGERLRRLMGEREFTQEQLAKASGVPQTTISEHTRDRTKRTNADVIEALAHALGVHYAYLRFGDDSDFDPANDAEVEWMRLYRSLPEDEDREWQLQQLRRYHARFSPPPGSSREE